MKTNAARTKTIISSPAKLWSRPSSRMAFMPSLWLGSAGSTMNGRKASLLITTHAHLFKFVVVILWKNLFNHSMNRVSMRSLKHTRMGSAERLLYDREYVQPASSASKGTLRTSFRTTFDQGVCRTGLTQAYLETSK